MAESNGTSDKVKETAEKLQVEAAEELKDLGRELRKRAESAREEVVKQLHNVAAGIRKEVYENDKADPALKANIDKMAGGLEKAATYLNSRNLDQIGGDATRVVRSNPWRALATLFIIGLVVGIFLRRGD